MTISLKRICVLTIMTFTLNGFTQDSIGHEIFTDVRINLFEGMIEDYLPFDVPFTMSGEVSDYVTKLEFFYAPSRKLNQKAVFKKGGKTCADTGFEISKTINLSLTDKKLKDSTLSAYYAIDTIKNKFWGYTSWKRPAEALRPSVRDTTKSDTFHAVIAPLKPNTNYSFFVRITYRLPVNNGEVLELLKDYTQQKNIENMQNFHNVYEDARSEVEPQLDSLNIPYTYMNLIRYLTPKGISVYELLDDGKTKELIQESIFTAPYLDDKDKKILYAKMAQRVQRKLQEDYGINETESAIIVNLINSGLGDEVISKYRELNLKHLLLTLEINDAASEITLDDQEVFEVLMRNNLTAQLTEYDKLRSLRVTDGLNAELNYGSAEFGTSNELVSLDQIGSSKELDKYITNVKKLILGIAEVKSKIKSGFTRDKISLYLNPDLHKILQEELTEIQNKLDKEQDEKKKKELEIQKADAENRIEWLKTKSEKDLRKILLTYDDYTMTLKNVIIPKLVTIKLNFSEIEQLWSDLQRDINIKVETKDDYASAFQNTTTNNFMTRAEYYISADFGLAGMFFDEPFTDGWGLKTIQPYLGVNFNLFPVNRQAHYNLIEKPFYSDSYLRKRCYYYWRNVFRGSSVVLGVTNRNVGIDVYGGNDEITSIWENTNIMLLTGYGIRISDYFRFTVGTSWYRYKASIHPFEDQQYKLAAGLYFSLSADLDVRKFFGTVGTLLINRN